MEQLKELISVVTKNKAKSIDIVGYGNTGEGSVQRLYQTLAMGEELPEDNIIANFYPGHDAPGPNFNRLKRQLKQRLLNTLFFIDVNQPEFNDMQKAYYT